MKLSCATLALLITIVITSIFVANVANLINIDRNLTKKWNHQHRARTASQQQQHQQLPPTMGTDPGHLMWFLQISDLHISIFGDRSRIDEFRDFATNTVATIRPRVVLVSGDLTDAKDRDHLGSRQYLDEWLIYRDIVHGADLAANRTVWLDIRGNHDNFNVPGDTSALNYYREYSVQGGAHARSYMHQVVGTSGEKYTFIAVDACLEPGPKRPFNFIGVLSANDTQAIGRMVESAQASGSNYTIWFGHYPTSCIVSMERGAWGLRRMIGQHDQSVAYMCGHLHQLGGAVTQMYTLQNDGFLELELSDWKSNRTFRLAAIDHGMFSFVDVPHGKWPVVLVTNPKNAMYHLPGKEDPAVQMDSTHIRLLVFSPSPIENCAVRIDRTDSLLTCTPTIDNPQLFVAAWDPSAYGHGLHHLEVFVSDTRGRQHRVQQTFSIDGTPDSFPLLARLVLMCDASSVFRCLFAVAAAACIAPLLFFRVWNVLVGRRLVLRPTTGCRGGYSRSVFRRFWLLSTIDRLAVPLVLYIVYLCVGPWAYGEVIDGHWGWIFAWGIYVNGGFLPGSLTYLYGFFQLVMCQLPLMWIFGRCVDERYCRLVGVPEKPRSGWARRFEHVPFAIIVAVELVLAVFFWNAYGALAFVCGPFRTWSVVLHIVLWHVARRVPERSMRAAMQIWTSVDNGGGVCNDMNLPHRL